MREYPIYVLEQLAGGLQAMRAAKVTEFELWAIQRDISKRFHKDGFGVFYQRKPEKPSGTRVSGLFIHTREMIRDRARSRKPRQPRLATFDELLSFVKPSIMEFLEDNGVADRWDTPWTPEEVKRRKPLFAGLGDKGHSAVEALERFWESGDCHLLFDTNDKVQTAREFSTRMKGELHKIGFERVMIKALGHVFLTANHIDQIPEMPKSEEELLDYYWKVAEEHLITHPLMHQPVNAHLTRVWKSRGLPVPSNW